MRIAVIGAGAMGCLFAARLAMAGNELIVVDTDATRLEAIARNGIVLADSQGERTASVSARSAEAIDEPVDLVVLFTKGMHSAAAIRSVSYLAKGDCSVLTLQNGLGNVEAIAEVFPRDRIIWGVTDFPADLVAANRVESHGDGHIWLGSLLPEGAARAAAVAAALNDADLFAEIHADVMALVWEKAAFNSILNALCTLAGVSVGHLDSPVARPMIAQMLEEIAVTARAAGVDFRRDRVAAKVDFALANHIGHKPSMLQDRIAGRRSEIESINGAVLRLAERHGVSTPVLRTVTDLVRLGEPQ